MNGAYRTNTGGAVTQLGHRAANRQRPVTSLRRIRSLYPAFVRQKVVDMLYTNNSWCLKEFVNELRKEINRVKSVIMSQARVANHRAVPEVLDRSWGTPQNAPNLVRYLC